MMIDDLQTANDLLEGAVNQRNAAQNECMQLAAALKAARREITELQEKLAKEIGDKPIANGRVEAAA